MILNWDKQSALQTLPYSQRCLGRQSRSKAISGREGSPPA